VLLFTEYFQSNSQQLNYIDMGELSFQVLA
jgi:hypothetical protein